MTAEERRHAEIAFVLAEAMVFRRVMSKLDGLRTLYLLPHLAMFATESVEYLRRRGMATGSFGANVEPLLRMRHALKLLDNHRQSSEEILDRYARIVAASRRVHLSEHQGLRGVLARWFQPDLGLFFERGRLVGTTHLATALLGPSDTQLEAMSHGTLVGDLYSHSHILGHYIGAVLRVFPVGSEGALPLTRPPLQPLETIDVRGERYYAPLVRSREPRAVGAAMLLASVVAAANAARYMLPALLVCTDAAEQLFLMKRRVVTLVHVSSTIGRILQEDHARPVLRAHVTADLVMLRRRLARLPTLRKLRNDLVHHELRGDRRAIPSKVSLNQTLEQGLEDVAATLAGHLPHPPQLARQVGRKDHQG